MRPGESLREARDEAFVETQARHFAGADAAHFAWQVGGPGFAPLEADLLAPVAAAFASPYLEIGCGEGANFVHVGGHGLRVGVDRFADKLAFARAHVAGVTFIGADAAALPFETGCMRLVLVRDVLHHVPSPERVVTEAVRVLAPGGRLFVVEPNGSNPLIGLQARVVAAEAGLAGSRREALEALLRTQPLTQLSLEMRQALPLRRLLLHYRFGLPTLGRLGAVRWMLDRLEAAAARVMPAYSWSYLVFSGERV